MVTLLGQKLDLAAKFRGGGFTVGETTEDGADVALALSSAGGVYVRDSDPALVDRIVAWLQQQDWCGPVFTREGRRSLRHEAVRLTHRRAADIGLVLAADDGENRFGIAGGTFHDCGYPEGGGMHGGLHEFELRTWIALGGEGVRPGYVSPLTAGIVDILPTLLHMLGLDIPGHVQGRLLKEGFDAFAEAPLPETGEDLQSAEGADGYRAHIALDRVGETPYLRRAWRDRS